MPLKRSEFKELVKLSPKKVNPSVGGSVSDGGSVAPSVTSKAEKAKARAMDTMPGLEMVMSGEGEGEEEVNDTHLCMLCSM
jgi:hypothetical protein